MRQLRTALLAAAALTLLACGNPVSEGSTSGSTGFTTGHSTGFTTGQTNGNLNGSGVNGGSSGGTIEGSGSDTSGSGSGGTIEGSGSTTAGSDSGSTMAGTDSGSTSGGTDSGSTTAGTDSGSTSGGTDSGSSDSGSTGSGTDSGSTDSSSSSGGTSDSGSTSSGSSSASSSSGTVGSSGSSASSSSSSSSSGGTTGSSGTPANDLCSGAATLTVGNAALGTTLGATDDYTFKNSNCTGAFTSGPDVTYTFTAPVAGAYTFTVAPNGWDAALYLLPNCASAGQGMDSCLAGADAVGSGGPESITRSLAAGQSVVVVVDSYGASSGTFSLQVSGTTNTTCQTATALNLHAPGDTQAFSGTTFGDGDGGNDSFACGGLGPELVYSVTPSVDTAIDVHVQSQALPDGGGMIPVVYVSNTCTHEQDLACYGANVVGDAADLHVNHLAAGTPYFVWVDSRALSQGPFTATATLSTPIPAPANDNCEGTVPVIALNVSPDGGLFGSIPYSTVGGDDTVTEPFQSTDGLGCIAGYDDGNDVVFQLNIPAPIAGMTITTTGRTGSFQTLFLRQGPTCSDAETASGAGHSVACDAYSPYTFGALAAGTYFLWVEGDGNGIINVSVP